MNSKEESEWKYEVVVVGLGYVGIPLLLESLRNKIPAIGFDIDSEKILKLQQGNFRFDDNENQFDFNSFEVLVTNDASVLSQGKVVVICVPTPVDSDLKPDLTFVKDACTLLGSQLKKGQLVILESTVAPGTTRTLVKDTLESISNLRAGLDFYLSFSPERIDPSNSTYFLHNTPKIVGGLTERCTSEALNFYTKIINSVVAVKGLEEAEATKLLENIFRHVNIALINEFSIACELLGINVFEVIEAAKTKPFGFSAFWPSIGAGGHCIPVDPNYFREALLDATGKDFKFIKLANDINSAMPEYFKNLVIKYLNSSNSETKPTVLVLGLTYKPDIGDFRESSGIKLCNLLNAEGFSIHLHDAFPIPTKYRSLGTVIEDTELLKLISSADVILILQGHKKYIEMRELFRKYENKIISPLPPNLIPSNFGFKP